MTAKDPPILECRVRPGTAPAAASARVREVCAEVPGIAIAADSAADELRVLATTPAAIQALQQAVNALRSGVVVGQPGVLYRSTLLRTAEAERRIDTPDAFAVVRLRLTPLPRGSGLVFETEFEGPPPIDTINAAVERAARAQAAAGVDTAPDITDVRIVFAGGAYDPVRSDGAAFAEAATAALIQACRDGKLTRLEPVVSVGISVPRDDVRVLVNDLQACAGREVRRALTPKGIVVEAHLPLSVALTYQDRLKTLTEGRARLISAPAFAGFAEKDV